MRLQQRTYYIFFPAILFLLTITSVLKAQEESEERQIALWIYNIAFGANWEDENTMENFTIGVYSDKKVYKELQILSETRPIKKKRVKVSFLKRYKDFEKEKPHILYVGKRENAYLDVIYSKIKGSRTLMITDRAKSLQSTMINFMSDNESNRRFEINNENCKEQKFTLSKTLLKLGGSKSVLRDLFSETEKELQKQKEELKKKKAELLRQTALLDSQQMKIEKQKEEISKKENFIKLKEEEIIKQNKRLDSMSREIQRQRKKLENNLAVLNKQEERISKQEEAYKEQKKEMLAADEVLKAKQEQLKEIDKQLDEKDVTIKSQKEENNILYGMIALIAVLLFFVIRGFFRQQKVNKKLHKQNDDIKRQKEEIQNQAKQLELINSELEKLSIVASKTDNAVTIMDNQGNLEWVNAGFTRLYGFTLQLFKHEKGENIIKINHQKPKIQKLIKSCIAEKKTVVYESLNNKRDGDNIWVQTTITPTLDEEGNVSRLIAIDSDINKAKLAEREIREQHKMIIEQARELERQNLELEKLSLVASETDNAILMTDAEGYFIWVNDAYTRMFGFTFDDLTHKISNNIIGKNTSHNIKKYINSAIENLKSVDYEFQAPTKEGSKIWIHTTLTPITDKSGKLKYLIAIDTDITNLKKAEFEIRQKSEELMAQSEELRQQNERIEFQNQHIRASINYAKTIQQAILPRNREMAQFFNFFAIFKPKDIVSGDFYWFAHLPAKNGYGEKLFIAAVDCTGHGVPGAFMSMIGNQILKELVLENKIVKPAEILTRLDEQVKTALRQDETDNNDGMDMVLCRIEKRDDKYRIKFSGAKRPLYYYKNTDEDVSLVRGDRKSIGGVNLKRTKIYFTDTELLFKKGDRIWLGTDGYIDQNNVARRRFGTPRLMDILNQIKEEPLKEQKQILKDKLAEYQGRAAQRDDITLLGIDFDGRW